MCIRDSAWQVLQALKQVARDVNFSFWNAVRVDPGNSFTSKEKPSAARHSCTRLAL